MPRWTRLPTALAVFLCGASAGLAQSAPSLGAAASFTVLAGSRVTNSGPTRVSGNVGVSPGTTVTGFPPGTLTVGEIFADKPAARDAQKDAAKAYGDLAGQPCGVNLTGDLDGLTLGPGVYCFKSAAQLKGTLKLEGDADAVWVFKIANDLTTADDSSVLMTNGGVSNNVFWQVGGSATLGACSAFNGTILARNDVTFNAAVNMSGRALALNGAVTLSFDDLNLCFSCPLITMSDLPNGTVNAVYNQTILGGGGKAPYAFSVVAGSLPLGLTLTSGGMLSGNPTAPGRYEFTVLAVDSEGCSGLRCYTIVICPIITIDPPILPPATCGELYKAILKPSAGTAPYVFSVPPGSLPRGLTLSPDGELSGILQVCGDFIITVTFVDANGCSATRTYTFHIICPDLTIAPPTLPNGIVGAAYLEKLTASGCCPGPYVFSLMSGKLPAGLTLSSDGIICGTPSEPGCQTFTVKATDPVGGCTGSQTYTICPGCPTITIVPSSLPDGAVGKVYSETLTVRGSLEPYRFTFTGSLPSGLTLSSEGVLFGIPTTEGPFRITVKATDSYGCFGIRVYDGNVGPCPTIVLSPLDLLPAFPGVFYKQTIMASGGTEPYQYRVSEGELPNGLTLNGDTGVISGYPSIGNAAQRMGPTDMFTITATDKFGCSGMRMYSIRLLCPPLALSPSTLPSASVGTAYSRTLAASGGAPPYSFALILGSLPAGLTLSAGGALSGTPTTTGTSCFRVRATDSAGCSGGSTDYTIVVSPPTCPAGTAVMVFPPTLPPAQLGAPYSQTMVASGGTGPYTFSVSAGALPPGLTLNPVTGTISGTPTTGGNFTFTITATDANGCLGSQGCAMLLIEVVPTLSTWALLLLSVLLAAVGVGAARKGGV